MESRKPPFSYRRNLQDLYPPDPSQYPDDAGKYPPLTPAQYPAQDTSSARMPGYGSAPPMSYPPSSYNSQTPYAPSPYSPPAAIPQAAIPPGGTQSMDTVLSQTQKLTGTGFQPLSRQEREEAARIAIGAGFSFDGYQVVRREFFSHRYDPTLTIKDNSITFNNACISRLDEVIYIQVLVNPTAEKLVIRPCDEGARDAIRWCVARDDKRKSREITCRLFTAKLYDLMGWETLYRYKLQGTTINYRGEQMFVFDLASTEVYLPKMNETDENGNSHTRKARIMYPSSWRDSFGLTVEEHTQSSQVDLSEAYGFMDADEKAGEDPITVIDEKTGEVTMI